MNNRPKNYASKEKEGYYTVYVKDNKVVVTKHKDQTPRSVKHCDKQATARCHPDDNFNLGEALNIAVDRIFEDDIIRIGDTVRVVNEGKAYCVLQNWPGEYINLAHRYRYGVCPARNLKAKVVGIYEMYPNNIGYIINTLGEENMATESTRYNGLNVYNGIYVVDEIGLKKIKDGRFE